MKSINGFILFILAVSLLAACNKVTYKKTPGGMPYKLFRGEGNTMIKPGDFVKATFTVKVKDSIYFTTDGKMPIYLPVQESRQPYDISELWTKLRKGDSVIATQLMDTFIKRDPDRVGKEFKNGDEIVTTIKILDIFSSDSLARADEEKEKSVKRTSEIAVVQKYVDDKKIVTQKTSSGAFVHIKNPGDGPEIDSGKYISVMYKGQTFEGTVFDTNMDTSFHHTEPLSFPIGVQPMIKGFEEGLLLLRKGSEATIYIPSMLGYAERPNSPNIKPFDNLIFEVKVLDVQDQAPPAPPAPPMPQGARPQ